MPSFSIPARVPILLLVIWVAVPNACKAEIQGYAEISVAAGSQVNFRVKSTGSSFRVSWYNYEVVASRTYENDEVIQFDGYHIPLHKVSDAGIFPVKSQPPDQNDTYKMGCNWQISCTVDIPANWSSDFYLAKLQNDLGQYTFVPVIVRSSIPAAQAEIAVVSATNTWQAYNNYGGASFYTCTSPSCTAYSSIVSYDRPLINTAPSLSGHLSGIEHLLLKFLKSKGIGYEQLCDLDLHAGAATGLLNNYSIVILSGHSEYWSAEMKSALESFLDQGGKLINLSGNTMFWRIEFVGSQMEKVVRWRVFLPGGEFGVLGAGYRGGNCCPVCAGFEALRTHWIYKNTEVKQGCVFGEEGVSKDQIGCQDGSSGASGWEYDVVGPGSPPPCGNGLWTDCLELLAKGLNENGASQRVGSDMYIYHRGRGGYIFAAPSIMFTGSLVIDTVLQQIMLNVIQAFLSNNIPTAEESCCNGQRGDLNGDGSDANVLDINFAINRIFRNGPGAGCPGESDLNGDGRLLNILDLSFLINKCFRGGGDAGDCQYQ